MNIVDARGELCPKPVILTKNLLDSLEEGIVETIVDNEVARNNLQKLAESQGYMFKADKISETEYHTFITKDGSLKKTASDEDDSKVIMLCTDVLGKQEELGKILMKSFLYTVSETKPYPKAMLFLNTAVKLTTEGSESLDELKILEDAGVRIVSCGTCLDFLNLKESLKIGEIGNMYLIYEIASQAKNTISIG